MRKGNNQKSSFKFVMKMFMLMGIGFMIFGWIHSKISSSCTESTIGTIEYIDSYYLDDEKMYRPVYSYYVDGIRYETKATYSVKEKTNAGTIGESVKVKYNPNHPSTSILEDLEQDMGMFFGMLGKTLLIIGGGGFFFAIIIPSIPKSKNNRYYC